MLHDLDGRVEGGKLFFGRVDLLAANVLGGMDNLALQIAGVNHVKVNQPKGPNAGRGQVQGQR